MVVVATVVVVLATVVFSLLDVVQVELLLLLVGCAVHVGWVLVTDVELLNGGNGWGLFVVAVAAVELADAVVVHVVTFVGVVVGLLVVLGLGKNVVEPMVATGTLQGRQAHCNRCTTAGAAEISPWPSSTRPPKAA